MIFRLDFGTGRCKEGRQATTSRPSNLLPFFSRLRRKARAGKPAKWRFGCIRMVDLFRSPERDLTPLPVQDTLQARWHRRDRCLSGFAEGEYGAFAEKVIALSVASVAGLCLGWRDWYRKKHDHHQDRSGRSPHKGSDRTPGSLAGSSPLYKGASCWSP